jgi:ribosome-associated toxin RatA of RatAB toxin-antitoxin module
MSPGISRLLLACAAAFAAQAPAAEVAVHVARSGDAFQVDASAEFDGTVSRAWQVLTDYGRFAEFVPDLSSSRVLSREGNRAVVEQKGEARVLFFSFPIDVRLVVTEHPRERIVSQAVAGNFREMRGTYSLEAGQGRVMVRYAGRLVPDFFVPPVVGTLALRRNVEATFRALVGEMERQQQKQ